MGHVRALVSPYASACVVVENTAMTESQVADIAGDGCTDTDHVGNRRARQDPEGTGGAERHRGLRGSGGRRHRIAHTVCSVRAGLRVVTN